MKTDLDQTLLSKVKMTQQERERILNKISQKEKKPIQIKYYSSLIAAAVLMLFLSVSSFKIFEEKQENHSANPTSQLNHSAEEKESPKDPGDIDKEEIVYKMLNSIDNYDTAKGTYKDIHLYEGQMLETNTTFQWDLNEGKCYQHQTAPHSDGYSYIVCDGTKFYNLVVNDKIGKIEDESFGVDKRQRVQRDLSKERIKLGENSEVLDVERGDYPHIGVKRILFPQNLIKELLVRNTDWSLNHKTENILGRPTSLIQGNIKITKGVTTQGADSFKLYVDRSTGVILKYELMKNNDIIRNVFFTELEYNIKLDDKYFKKDIIKNSRE